MEKNNLNRLMRVLVPFIVMVIVQRLANMILGKTDLLPRACDIISFTSASAVGIVMFRRACGAGSLCLRPDSARGDGDELTRASVLEQILGTVLAFAALVTMMFAVTAMSDSNTRVFDVPEVSVYAVASLLILHPILEEYVFRWLFYRELRPMHPIFACLAQALMFAIIHGSVGEMMYALGSGIVLAITIEKTGSFPAVVIAHVLVNLRSFIYLTWLSDVAGVRTAIDFAIISAGIAAGFVLMIRQTIKESRAAADDDDDDE